MQSMQRKKVAVEIACGQHVNSAASPEDLHKLLVQALNSGDLDALVALYAYDGFLCQRHLERSRIVAHQSHYGENTPQRNDWPKHPVLQPNGSHGAFVLGAVGEEMMARSGPARGISAIRKALAEYVAMKPTLQLTTRRVVQAGDTCKV